ncbi:DUF2231 domain-containing protein [Sulfurimonas sp. HSL3-7]|uniref:DUF2231 domain-containing protein n=1 Tax=Sulfonitrofixus jiaomeiensis TaxID=3131938 RepID=UPI0031F87289
MNLPAITLPIEITDTVPVLLHPIAVHFAVVLPLVIMILELINLITKRKALSISVYVLFILLIGLFVAAYITGVTDGTEAGLFLSDEGKEALKGHKILGTYLVYLTLLPLLLKVLSLFVKKGWSRALYSLGLIILIALTFFQAKKGGELVYSYGANVSSQQLLEDKIETLEEDIDTLQSSCEEELAALKERYSDCNLTFAETNATAVQTPPDTNGTQGVTVDANASDTVIKTDLNGSAAPNKTKSGDANSSKP